MVELNPFHERKNEHNSKLSLPLHLPTKRRQERMDECRMDLPMPQRLHRFDIDDLIMNLFSLRYRQIHVYLLSYVSCSFVVIFAAFM